MNNIARSCIKKYVTVPSETNRKRSPL